MYVHVVYWYTYYVHGFGLNVRSSGDGFRNIRRDLVI